MNVANNVIGGLVASSILVSLNVSVWVGRKTDKKNTNKVVSDNNATSKDAALVTKKIFADNPLLAEVSRKASKARVYVDSISLPWMAGTKLLPMTKFLEFQENMEDLRIEFDAAVDAFLANYDIQVSAMAFKLGTLFDRGEYPMESELRQKFHMEWDFMPLPTSGDFRVDAEQALRTNLQEFYDTSVGNKVNESMKLVWEKLKTSLTHLVDRLGEDDSGKNNVFRDSLMENAHELVNLLSNFNITNDADMEQARKMLLAAIDGVEVKELRKNDETRSTVRADVQSILDKFTF